MFKIIGDLTKAEYKVLEKLFAAEIQSALDNNDLPVQIRSKHLDGLEKKGLVKRVSVTLGGRFPVTIIGWTLTADGHLTYCMNCHD